MCLIFVCVLNDCTVEVLFNDALAIMYCESMLILFYCRDFAKTIPRDFTVQYDSDAQKVETSALK